MQREAFYGHCVALSSWQKWSTKKFKVLYTTIREIQSEPPATQGLTAAGPNILELVTGILTAWIKITTFQRPSSIQLNYYALRTNFIDRAWGYIIEDILFL